MHNSPLSEYGALGFEYGYSVAAPEALVLWEAQFGDFVNVAQVIIDQFLVSGLAKWGQTSRLTLLLPHGFEGNGPEHSSARLERFLQSAAQENIRVANASTAAQYFHLLRRQALDADAAAARRDDAEGAAAAQGGRRRRSTSSPPAVRARCSTIRAPTSERVRRLVLCSGKVFYDIDGHERSARRRDGRGRAHRAALSVPGPAGAAARRLVPGLEEIVWAQEEPLNMGAYRSIRHRLEDALPAGVLLRYVGRPWRASPSEGYPTAHLREQDRIVRDVLADASVLARRLRWRRSPAACARPSGRAFAPA